MRIDGRDYLTSAQTASYLGVRVQTVYAYVSRGLVRSTSIAGRRGSFFALVDVEELARRGRSPRAAAAGADRVHTHITLIGPDDRLSFRGRDVGELVRDGTTYEQVCALLWQVPEPRLVAGAEQRALVARLGSVLPDEARALDLLTLVVGLAGAADPLRGDLRPEAVTAVAARLLGLVVDALAWRSGARPDPEASLATRLAAALAEGEPRAEQAQLVDAALVLLADHDLAMSTRAARVAASARAHPYAVVSAALGAMDSPLHGTAPRSAHRLLADVLDEPATTVAGLVAAPEPPPGFGHRIYRHADPRAVALRGALGERLGDDAPALRAYDRLVAAMVRRFDTFATSDLALAALAHAAGWRAEAGEVLFTVARMAGWIAHALEEYEADPLRYRIAGVYAGVRP